MKQQSILFGLITFTIALLLILPSISALELNPFGDSKSYYNQIDSGMGDYIKQDFNSKYGAIILDTTFMWIKTGKIAEYSLIHNTEICIDCEQVVKVTLYRDMPLFEKIDYNVLTGGKNPLEKSKVLLLTNENYEVSIPYTEEVCKEIDNKTTGKLENSCDRVWRTKTETRTREKYIEYKGEVLKAGDYLYKITGRINKGYKVDVIQTADEHEFKEWAPWTAADCAGTGGDIVIDGDYCVHTFLSNGTFAATRDITAEVLVIGGGGAGGYDTDGNNDGGGGAGGYNYNSSYLIATNSYDVKVGEGGVNSTLNTILAANSSFGDMIGLAGGAGGHYEIGFTKTADDGGSGGGGAQNNAVPGENLSYSGAFQGKRGGFGVNGGYGAGGGGAGEMGHNETFSMGGDSHGGDGLQNDINGTLVWYAGGGGGGNSGGEGPAAGGQGGGGQGGKHTVVHGGFGVNGTGGGGGGESGNANAGGGGSGIVIIRYGIGIDGFLMTMSYPVNDTNLTESNTVNLGCNFTSVGQNITAVNVTVYNASNYLSYQGSNVTGDVNTSYNMTWTTGVLIDGTYKWACQGYGNQGKNATSVNRTFHLDTTSPTIFSSTYNASTYETFSESFILNSSRTISAALVYSGTSHAAATSGNISSVTITIPASTGNKTFYWKLNGGAYNTSNYYQYVNPIQLGLCNSTNNIAYVNYTFKDETTLVNINATFNPFNAVYYLSDVDYNKTLLFINASENGNYSFCFTPAHKTMNLKPTITYGATGYPSRVYNPGFAAYTNVSTLKTLYLLSSGSGIYVTFQTTNTQGSIITGVDVLVETQLDGNWTTVGTAITDAAGTATFWLNPTAEHRITFTKSTCTQVINTIYPTQSSYTQAMSCTGDTSDVTGLVFTGSLDGITILRSPQSGVVNPGMQNFSYSVYSLRKNLAGIRIEVVNMSEYILNYSTMTCTNNTFCQTSVLYNFTNGQRAKGRYLVNTTNTTGWILVEADAYWRFITINVSDGGTVRDFFNDLGSLFYTWGEDPDNCGANANNAACTAAGCKWVNLRGSGTCIPADRENKQEFSRIVLLFFFVAFAIAALNKFTGIDSSVPGMAMYAAFILIAIGSISGGLACTNGGCQGLFYYDGLMPAGSGATSSYFAGFINNYLLMITMTFLIVGHTFSTMRRYS